MQLQTTYLHMQPSESINDVIREKAAKLEQFYDRITRCHVVVEAPSNPRRQGSQYRVRLDIAVPGDEIVVNREPTQQGDKELAIALRDAFEAARRQIEDFADLRRGEARSLS